MTPNFEKRPTTVLKLDMFKNSSAYIFCTFVRPAVKILMAKSSQYFSYWKQTWVGSDDLLSGIQKCDLSNDSFHDKMPRKSFWGLKLSLLSPEHITFPKQMIVD